jgi:hypothetical protein
VANLLGLGSKVREHQLSIEKNDHADTPSRALLPMVPLTTLPLTLGTALTPFTITCGTTTFLMSRSIRGRTRAVRRTAQSNADRQLSLNLQSQQ